MCGVAVSIYPPTPALAKAGAAPGTTAGVELFFVPNALHFPRATQAIAPSVHRPGATQATAISVHFPRATHATAISVSTAFQNATGRGRPCAVPTSPWGRGSKEVQGCRLPAFKTPQTLPCSSQAPLRPRQTFPAAPTSPWGRGSVFLWTFKAAVCQPSKLPKPFPAAPRRHSGRGRPFLQLQQVPEAVAASFYGRSRLPFASPQNSPNPSLQLPGATQAAADLSCSSNKSLRPWQRLFMDVQGCRLPALKTPEAVAASFYGRSNPSLQLPGATQAAADLSCSSNKSLRPWQCPFMDVQGCRLPALKTPQTLPCSSQAPLRPRQTFPAAPTSPWGRGSVFLWTFKAAVCQPSKLPKPFPAAPRRHSGRGRPFLQLQQVPEAVAASFYGRSRLPFASPQNSPNPSLQLAGATQAAADLSCSSNKSLRPWQCPFKEVQGCRLPAFKTPQTLPCSSQAPLRPRQTFPAALTSPWGRGSVFLWTFKAAVCQPSKLPKPFPAARRRHSGRGRPFLQLQQVPEAVAVSF